MQAPNTHKQDDYDWGSKSHVQTLVMMLLTVLGLYLCYKMAIPFLAVLVWALTLAVLFSPLQGYLERRLKASGLAALVSVLIIGLIVVIPAVFVGQQLLFQAVKGAQSIEVKLSSGEWQHKFTRRPSASRYIVRPLGNVYMSYCGFTLTRCASDVLSRST